MDRILIADDDRELCGLLTDYLRGQGFELACVHDGQAAVTSAGDGYQALILDVMMPQLDGFQALALIRQKSRIPIVMLTARGEDVDRILGLEMGADDYLPKPFNPRELAARLRAILRRRNAQQAQDGLRAGDIEVLPASREVRLAGKELALTGTEFEVLHALAQSAGDIVDRDQLSRAALGRRWRPNDRSLDMHIVNLRRKLGENRLKTVRNRGYLLVR